MFERLFDVYVPTLLREAERFAKIKALSISLEVLDGERRLFRTYFFTLLWVVAFTAAVFSAVLRGVTEYGRTGTVHFDGFMGFALVVAIVALAIAADRFREKTWLKAFDVQKRLSELASAPASAAQAAAQAMDARGLSRLLDELLEEKFAKYAERLSAERAKAPEAHAPRAS